MQTLNIPHKYIEFIKKVYIENRVNEDNHKNFFVGEKIAEHYIDAKKFNASEELIYFLIYESIRFAYNIKPIEPKYTFNYFEEIFNNKNVCDLIRNSECKSEFYTIIKDILPYYEELEDLIRNNKKYMALKKYKEILSILNMETLNLYPKDMWEKECQKRYRFTYNKKVYYEANLKHKHYKQEDKFDFKTLPFMNNNSLTCSLLIHYFHQKMVNFYKKSNYIYKPVNDDYGFYKLNNINIITYNFDDLINVNVNHLKRNYNMKKPEFWGIIFSKGIKFNYFIPKKFKRLASRYKPCIIVPDDYIDEALVHFLSSETGYDINNMFLQKELIKIGFPLEGFEEKEGLLNAENTVYFKNPQMVDKLKVKDINNFKTLKKILLKPISKRNAYYKKLASYYKGKIKKITEANEQMANYKPSIKKEKRDWYSK